jgi:two-component system, NtrC family, sensor histidine kinase HydH
MSQTSETMPSAQRLELKRAFRLLAVLFMTIPALEIVSPLAPGIVWPLTLFCSALSLIMVRITRVGSSRLIHLLILIFPPVITVTLVGGAYLIPEGRPIVHGFLLTFPLFGFALYWERVVPVVGIALISFAALMGLLLLDGTPGDIIIRWGCAFVISSSISVYAVRRAQRLQHLRGFERGRRIGQLTHALASGTFVKLRSANCVLSKSCQLMAAQGFHASFLLLDGDFLRAGPATPGIVRFERYARAALLATPLETIRLPLSQLPYAINLFENGKATFRPDIRNELLAVLPPRVVRMTRFVLPQQTLDIPLIVQGQPYGVMSVWGAQLDSTNFPAFELFARHIEAAVENIRHLDDAVERIEEVRRLQKELVDRERLAALGEAAAVLAHEVRNPVGVICNSLALLRRDSGFSKNSEQVLEIMQEEANRLSLLMNDLLFLSRPTEPHKRLTAVGELARRLVETLRHHSAFQSVGLQAEVREPLPTVWADALHLEAALANLLLNAAHASPPGACVQLRVVSDGGQICIQIDDQGAGVPSELREKIFEPFFTTRATGTGLGLSIVRRVAETHGAHVDVRQNEHGGARFELILRATDLQAHQHAS